MKKQLEFNTLYLHRGYMVGLWQFQIYSENNSINMFTLPFKKSTRMLHFFSDAALYVELTVGNIFFTSSNTCS